MVKRKLGCTVAVYERARVCLFNLRMPCTLVQFFLGEYTCADFFLRGIHSEARQNLSLHLGHKFGGPSVSVDLESQDGPRKIHAGRRSAFPFSYEMR